MPPDPAPALGILLISGSFERAHYAFVIAAGAAAIGRQVVLFATHAGCHALCADWSGLTGAEADAVWQARGIAGLRTLRAAAQELEVRLIACESGLRAAAIDPTLLINNVEIAGVATFLSAAGAGQLLTL